MSWTNVALGELTSKIGSGATPRGGQKAYQKEGIPLIRSMNVHDGLFVEDGLAYLDEQQAEGLANVELAVGDVLLNITGASVARSCRVPDRFEGGRVNQHVAIIRPDQRRLSPDYLEHILINPRTKANLLRIAGGGATREAITKKAIEEFQIPLPPLEEQKRIAGILDQTDALFRLRQRAKDRLNTLGQAIFNKMFGDSSDLEQRELEEVADLKRGPFGGALKKEIFVDSGYQVYEQSHAISKDCSTGRYFIDERKFREMEAFSIEPNDLLVSCSGTLGRVVRLPQGAPQGVINQALLRIRPYSNRVKPEYLEAFIESPNMTRFLTGFSRGTGLQNFPPMSEVKKIRVPVPSIEQQETFLEITKHISIANERLELSARNIRALVSSIQNYAFRGEL